MKRQMLQSVTLLALSLVCGIARAAMPGVTVQSLRVDFDEVKERVVTAIENRGLVIDHTAQSMKALREVGKLLDGIVRDALK